MLMAPTIAVTAAWARTSTEHERDTLHELLDYPGTRVEPLDQAEAAAVALTLAEVGQPDLLTAGHVALRAERYPWSPLTQNHSTSSTQNHRHHPHHMTPDLSAAGPPLETWRCVRARWSVRRRRARR